MANIFLCFSECPVTLWRHPFTFETTENTFHWWSSSAAEFHRYALTEPYVSLSTHTALVIQP